MPSKSDENFENWIASRKQSDPADLLWEVMNSIEPKADPVPQKPSFLNPPPWLLAVGCFLAGLGKISLVLHLAF